MRRLSYYVVKVVYVLAMLLFILIDAGTEISFILQNHWEIVNPLLQIKVIFSLLFNPFWWAAVVVGTTAHYASEKLDHSCGTATGSTSSVPHEAFKVIDFDMEEPLTYEEELLAYQQELALTRKSIGHVAFRGKSEYFIRPDGLYASLLTNSVDANGQRSNAFRVCPNSEIQSVLNLLHVRER